VQKRENRITFIVSDNQQSEKWIILENKEVKAVIDPPDEHVPFSVLI
jgi:hypothetical protein